MSQSTPPPDDPWPSQPSRAARQVHAVLAWLVVEADVPNDVYKHLVEGALVLAAAIAANGPVAVRATKRLVTAAADSTGGGAWELQNAVLAEVLASADAREGSAAFVEKRPPVWVGE